MHTSFKKPSNDGLNCFMEGLDEVGVDLSSGHIVCIWPLTNDEDLDNYSWTISSAIPVIDPTRKINTRTSAHLNPSEPFKYEKKRFATNMTVNSSVVESENMSLSDLDQQSVNSSQEEEKLFNLTTEDVSPKKRWSRKGRKPRKCSNCSTIKSCCWRRDKENNSWLCNCCGLFLLGHQTARPVTSDGKIQRTPRANASAPRTRRSSFPTRVMIVWSDILGSAVELTDVSEGSDAELEPTQSEPLISDRHCDHCRANSSPAWRRGPNETTLCNACGIYFQQQGVNRPLRLANRRHTLSV